MTYPTNIYIPSTNMSGSAPTSSPSKRARKDKRKNDGTTTNGSAVGSGSATPTPAPTENAGTTNNVTKNTSPLQAALVSMKESMKSLPSVSHPFLTPLCENILRLGSNYQYQDDKVIEMKSTPNYVSSAARKLNIVLPSDAEAQKSQAFMTLRDDLTAELEEIRVKISRNYVIKAAELTLNAKKTKYQAAVCTYVRQLAMTFIAQYDTKNYTGDQAVMDVITHKHDEMLVPFKFTLKEFLILYKATNNLQVVPYPTVDLDTSDKIIIDAVNNVVAPPPPAPYPPPPRTPSTSTALVVVTPQTAEDHLRGIPDSTFATSTEDEDNEAMEGNNPSDGITGGKHHIARLTYNAFVTTILHPMQDYFDQRGTNDEMKRIKTTLTPPSLTSAATRIAAVLGNEPPAASQPVLRGLVGEMSSANTSALERRLQSLEDQLAKAKSKSSTTTAKKVKGDGTTLKGILRTGTPIAAKTNAPKKSPKKKPSSKSKKSSSSKNRTANDNDTTSAKGKSKGNGRKVSFVGKKTTYRLNSKK